MTKQELRSKIEEYDVYVPTRMSKGMLEITLEICQTPRAVGIREQETEGYAVTFAEDDELPF